MYWDIKLPVLVSSPPGDNQKVIERMIKQELTLCKLL